MYPSVPFARLGLTQYFAQIAAQTPCLIMITKSGKIYLICCIFPIISTIHSFWSNKASLTINNYQYQQSKMYLTSNSFLPEILFLLNNFYVQIKFFGGKTIFRQTVAPRFVENSTIFFGTLPLEMGWYSLLNTYWGTINKPINIPDYLNLNLKVKKLRERWIIMPSF